MAFNLLDRFTEDTDGTSVTSGSVTPTGEALLLLGILAHDDEDAPEAVDSFSGTGWANGLTWTLEGSVDVANGDDGGTGKLMLYSATAPASPSAGTVTATFVATHEKYMLYLMEDTVNPDVVQTATGTSTGLSLSISLSSPTGLTGMFGAQAENASLSAGTGFTALGKGSGGAVVPQWSTQGIYDDTDSTNPVVLDSNTGDDNMLGIAFETGTAGATEIPTESEMHAVSWMEAAPTLEDPPEPGSKRHRRNKPSVSTGVGVS